MDRSRALSICGVGRYHAAGAGTIDAELHIRCVGVAVNTGALDTAAARDYLRRTEDALGLPTVDPVRTGVGTIVDRLPG